MKPVRWGGVLLLLCAATAWASSGYPTPAQVAEEARAVPGARLHTLAETPGGNDVLLLELGEGEERPAVLVVANMEGDAPPATRAALALARRLAEEWSGELERRTWYILPLGNPDGHQRLFHEPKVETTLNDRDVDDDLDGVSGEDPPEDLNGDGMVTVMRFQHPEGRYLEDEQTPGLMRKADPAKGERGRWKLLPEGVDNDRDGRLNEDGPGGVNPGRNFPRGFTHYERGAGIWPGSEPASRAVLEFAHVRRNIAMIIVLGRSSTLAHVPEGAQREERYKPPRWMASRMGVRPDRRYPLDELLALVRQQPRFRNMTGVRLLRWLDAGPAEAPPREDLAWWKRAAEDWEQHRDSTESVERLSPERPKPGSVELWAYYQYGVPTFALDVWTLPRPAQPADTAAGEGDAGGKGEERPSGSRTGGEDEDPLATCRAFAALPGGGLLPWQEVEHPEYGAVEVGGAPPWGKTAPPVEQVDPLIEARLPFLLELASRLPGLQLAGVEVEEVGEEVWSVTAWVENSGELPLPTFHGQRTMRPAPTTLTLEGKGVTFVEGRPRAVLRSLEPGVPGRVSWVVAGGEGSSLELLVENPAAGSLTRTIKLREGER